MARLDKLIQVMHEQRADGLQLATGKPAALILNGSPRPVTREPLATAQIVALLKEIAPPAVGATLTPSSRASFGYSAPSGSIQVVATPDEAGVMAMLRRADGSAAVAPPQEITPPRGQPAAPPPAAVATPLPEPAPAAPRAPSASRPASGGDASGGRAAIESLFRLLVESRSSDLHLRTGEPPVLRKDGEMVRQERGVLSADQLDGMLAGIMSPKTREEYEERGDTDWAYEIPDLARFRCNAGRDRHGPFGVFRIIPTAVPSADQLGLGQPVQNLAYLTKGLVVVTGPTGSGKSTTLASLIDLINRTRHDHIITIEDPIEFVHSSKKCVVTQREVGVHTAGFKQALRAALREDPDIVLVGEMRDLETVAIAIETAETGHLVFGTLHTTTAASTIDRIIDQFPPDRQAQVRVMLSESLRGVIAQTLCRKIGGGRVAAREVLITIPAISNLIREGKTFQIPSIMQTNRKGGMVTMNDALMELVDAKLVEPKEAYMKAIEKPTFMAALKAKNHDVSFLGEV